MQPYLIVILVFIATIGIALLAQWHVRRVYQRYSRVPAADGRTGAEVARELLRTAGLSDVSVYERDDLLGDHYDPVKKCLVLSTPNFYGTSLAALGVAAHECGHAIQHQRAHLALRVRMAAVVMASFASHFLLWIPLLGVLAGVLTWYAGVLTLTAAWGIIMLFNLITLPVEFDASRRAGEVLAELQLEGSAAEREGLAQVLNAAGWTYVAGFFTFPVYFVVRLLPMMTSRARG